MNPSAHLPQHLKHTGNGHFLRDGGDAAQPQHGADLAFVHQAVPAKSQVLGPYHQQAIYLLQVQKGGADEGHVCNRHVAVRECQCPGPLKVKHLCQLLPK